MITPNCARLSPAVHPRNASFGLSPRVEQTVRLSELRLKL